MGEKSLFLHRSHFRFLKCVLSDACPPTGLTNARFPKIAATRSVSNLRIHSPPEFLNPSPVRPAILSELLSSICFPQSPWALVGRQRPGRRAQLGDPCNRGLTLQGLWAFSGQPARHAPPCSPTLDAWRCQRAEWGAALFLPSRLQSFIYICRKEINKGLRRKGLA